MVDVFALALGIGGLTRSDCQRITAVLGTTLSGIILLGIVALLVVGYLSYGSR